MKPMVVMTGGGIKGAAVAGRYAKDHELLLLHVNYGQPSAAREINALESFVAAFHGATVLPISMPHFIQLQRGAAEVEVRPASQGASRAARQDPSTGMSPNVLRGLMPMLLATGVQAALRIGSEGVALGLTRTTDATHLGLAGLESAADQRRELVHAYNIMAETALRPRPAVRLEAPLMELSYAEVIQLAVRFRVPLERTWTCSGIGPQPCGQCPPCVARSRAFSDAAIADPAAAPPTSPHVRGPGLVRASAAPTPA